MDYVIPIVVFALMVILGNVLDKKKPPAQPIPKDWTPPDIRGPQEPPPPQHRPHHPDEYAQVHNPYQEYLTRHTDDYEEKHEEPPQDPSYTTEHKRKPLSGMAQAVIWAEILGKPKARRNRLR